MHKFCFILLLFAYGNGKEEHLDDLFREKNCIEASQISIFASATSNTIMIEKDSLSFKLQLPLINLTEITQTKTDKNVLNKINELAQYNKLQYTYELTSEEGPVHKRTFKIRLKLGDESYEEKGSSLKDAQRAAATLALANTNYEQSPIKLEKEKIVETPTVILNNVALKLGIAVSYFLVNDKKETDISNYSPEDFSGKTMRKSYIQKLNESIYHPNKKVLKVPTEEAQISGPFTVRVRVGESVFVGIGHTIQSARHDAATRAIKGLEKELLLKNNECSNEETFDLCKQRKEALKSAISRVFEAGQKHKLAVDFEVVGETGKSHNKWFIMRCKLGEFETQGEGKSKNEAKREAAEKMLANLAQLPEIVDGKEIINSVSKKKKKKKKIIKAAGSFTAEISGMLSNFLDFNHKDSISDSDDGKLNQNRDSLSPKDKLLEIGNLLKVDVQFADLPKKSDKFRAVTTLGVHPMHVCLGVASTQESAHKEAALHGLDFLFKSGLLKNKFYFDEKSRIGAHYEEFEVDEQNVIYASIDKSSKKE